MPLRLEKTTRRVAGRMRQVTKSAATATRRASDVLDQIERATRSLDDRRTLKKVSKSIKRMAKAAAVGAASVGLKRAVDAVGKKLRRPKPSRAKKALRVAGAVAVVAGAAVLVGKVAKARQVAKSRRATSTGPQAMEPEEVLNPSI